jgi:hypothetical protein
MKSFRLVIMASVTRYVLLLSNLMRSLCRNQTLLFATFVQSSLRHATSLAVSKGLHD